MDADDPTPVHLDHVMDGLGVNPALPAPAVRPLFAWRDGFGKVAGRADLTEDMIEEIIATDDRWLLHGLARNDRLPERSRLRLAAHPDEGVRAALATRAASAPRRMLELLVDDPDVTVREHLAQVDGLAPDLGVRLAADPEPQVRAALAQHWT
ncbi:hypothetical protein ACFWP2_19180 [Kitasatospora sp. NPDC058444]|uniref:hypothetical protein n=1 Tax=Kitasatospora sp. NPDC058444 TaxID=3346504 RepID=UPI00364E1552